jgi:glycosyltransferase involved in cell wall biosynthesis
MMIKNKKVALVFENLFSWGGTSVVNKSLLEIFPQADVFALFGSQQFSDKYLNGKKIKFSFLNKFPFVNKLYPFYLPFWPIAIESLDLSSYDLVISSSSWVAKGCITSEDALHISYIHTPMRFLWDQKSTYSKYGLIKAPFLNYLRMWDVSSSRRPEKIITNSKFVSRRCKRYWGREADIVINPPVYLYDGELVDYRKRDNYFVTGAPFAENKGGDFLIECARELKFNLKIIGKSRGYTKLKRKARNNKNIEFLGKISEEEKWKILSNAKGFLATGIEDFGIFPIEAISCGTPVLALNRGGYKESIVDGVNGIFYDSNTLEKFKIGMERFCDIDWNNGAVSVSVKKFIAKRFEIMFNMYIDKLL